MTEPTDITPMTARERGDLQQIARMNARVMKGDVDAMVASRYAEFEQALSRDWTAQELGVQEMLADAQQKVAEINDEIQRQCDLQGIRDELRPRLYNMLNASPRAGNERQGELRRIARAELDAAGKKAKVEIDRQTAALCTDIVSRGLTSIEAKGLLERVQSVDELVPGLQLKAVEAKASHLRAL